MTSAPIPLASQVGGHAGVQTTEDGSLLIKPALPAELAFYQALSDDSPFAPLRRYLPKFLGTLSLAGKVEEGEDLEKMGPPPAGAEKQNLVLENLSFPFKKPNILDIKLGTILYDESASPEKVERMIKTAKETTSLETGVRLTGFQVYDNLTNTPVNTPKSYGKSIKVTDLPDGIAKFFPVAHASTGDPSSTNTQTTSDTQPTPTTGLPSSTLLPILRDIRRDVAAIREHLSKIEMRMVGGSVLIIYEADWERAAEAAARIGTPEEEDDEEIDSDEDEDEGKDDESQQNKPGPAFVVKLIDFAHTRLAPGEGPDAGVLLGLDTTLKLLDGRIAQVETGSDVVEGVL
ncbi:SAICAR synthase-like protein [Schizophyllum commune Loenen D]|nr:SAICAR synthase-like protein [Schizophyllum commune Loenen D]